MEAKGRRLEGRLWWREVKRSWKGRGGLGFGRQNTSLWTHSHDFLVIFFFVLICHMTFQSGRRAAYVSTLVIYEKIFILYHLVFFDFKYFFLRWHLIYSEMDGLDGLIGNINFTSVTCLIFIFDVLIWEKVFKFGKLSREKYLQTLGCLCLHRLSWQWIRLHQMVLMCSFLQVLPHWLWMQTVEASIFFHFQIFLKILLFTLGLVLVGGVF